VHQLVLGQTAALRLGIYILWQAALAAPLHDRGWKYYRFSTNRCNRMTNQGGLPPAAFRISAFGCTV